MNEHSKRAGANGTGVAGSIGARDALTELLRHGAVDLLATAVQAEAAAWKSKLEAARAEQGKAGVEGSK